MAGDHDTGEKIGGSTRAPITTHILDTERGKPAADVEVFLYAIGGSNVDLLAKGLTNQDGRVEQWSQGFALKPGIYQLQFITAPYFHRCKVTSFYPQVSITFEVMDPQQHYHVPLLLSAHGYTTYRGS